MRGGEWDNGTRVTFYNSVFVMVLRVNLNSQSVTFAVYSGINFASSIPFLAQDNWKFQH